MTNDWHLFVVLLPPPSPTPVSHSSSSRLSRRLELAPERRGLLASRGVRDTPPLRRFPSLSSSSPRSRRSFAAILRSPAALPLSLGFSRAGGGSRSPPRRSSRSPPRRSSRSPPCRSSRSPPRRGANESSPSRWVAALRGHLRPLPPICLPPQAFRRARATSGPQPPCVSRGTAEEGHRSVSACETDEMFSRHVQRQIGLKAPHPMPQRPRSVS
jgi:hypothetical protein